MNPLNQEELALLNGLIKGQHISKDQSIKVLEGLKSQSKLGFPITLEDLLLKSHLVSPEIIDQVKNNANPKEDTINVTIQDVNTVDSQEISAHSIPKKPYEYLNGFRLEKSLGQGALGDSYLGELQGHGRVVLKVLNKNLIENQDYIASVQKLLDVIDFKSHEHLVPFTQIKGEEDHLFYWSPYFEGSSIGTTVRANGRLDINESISIAIKIAEVLKFFERINRPHLALDEENVFIDDEGKVILKDFEWNRDYFKSKSERVTVGPSVNYMSPEYLKGEPVSFRSDMYSLGALLFYMLTKRSVLTGNFEAQLMKKENNNFPDITEIRRDIPLTINTVIQKTLAFNPQDRYESFNELIEVLKEILEKRNKQQKSAAQQKSNSEDKLKSTNATIDDSFNKEESVEKKNYKDKKHSFSPYIILLLLLSIGASLYFLPKFDDPKITNSGEIIGSNNKPQNSSNPKVNKPKDVDKPVKKWSTKDVQIMVEQELSNRITIKKEKNKFSQRATALNVIRENLSENREIPQDVLNRVVEFHQETLATDRDNYWGIKKGILVRSFDKNEVEKIKEEIKNIRKETDDDEVILQKMAELIAKKTSDNPKIDQHFLISEESKKRATEVAKKSLPYVRNHEYKKLEEMYLNESVNENNLQQRKSYQDEVEFYEHAGKVKKFISEQDFKKSHLLRTLGLDEDGVVTSISSKGFHVDHNPKKVIPWNEISTKVLSMLATKYKPKTLGENISLLIYANRAGNHIAMKTTLREIQLKYKVAYETPLVNEIKENLKELESTLVTEWIEQQISLAKKLKDQRKKRSDNEIKMILDELKSEYRSHPVYIKNKVKIQKILAKEN